jgi:branched-chain amino acid transport system ATP-binding protein
VEAKPLEVNQLTVKFGGLIAIDKISLTLEEGSVFGVIGPNGAGKTTLLNAITGAVPVASGTVMARGRDITGLRPHRIAHYGVARSFQGADSFLSLTAVQALLLGRWTSRRRALLPTVLRSSRYRVQEADEVRTALEMLDTLGLTEDADVQLGELSYGTRKLLDVGRALLMRPDVLLLDEPTSGTTRTDRESLLTAMSEIRRLGISTILVDHDVEFTMKVCDRAMAMTSGRKLGEAAPDELLARSDVREAYIGLD